MEIWILAALAGWCPTGWPWPWPWRWPRYPLWPVPPIPDPGPGPLPDEKPQPVPWRPWQPILNGMFGAVGGIAAWAILGDRFGSDGALLSVVLISFLGGCVGLSIANTVDGLRGARR